MSATRALRPATREAQQGPIARYLRGGADALAAEEREQFHEGDDWRAEQIQGAGGDSMIIRAPQAATQSDDSSGQEAVEEEIPPRIIDTLTYYGGVARMVQHIMTGTGGDYRMMQMDADAQEGEILGSQDTAVTALDVPDIGVIVFTSKTYSSKPIILTREMIQDSVFDIQRYVERQALRRIGRISNKAFTITQTGTGLPQGIVNGASGRRHRRELPRPSPGRRRSTWSTKLTAPTARWARVAKALSCPRAAA